MGYPSKQSPQARKGIGETQPTRSTQEPQAGGLLRISKTFQQEGMTAQTGMTEAMAARKQPYHSEHVKKKIQTSQLINRLQNNALADEEFMTPGQIQSAIALIDRVVPKQKPVDDQGSSVDKQELKVTIGGD